MSRELREEIERQDARLKAAREAVQLLERELAAKGSHDASRKVALETEHAALLEEAERLRSRRDALQAERAKLEARIADGRAELARIRSSQVHQVVQEVHGMDPIDPEYPTRELFRPTGWRKSQPWYERLLYWLVKPPEWK
jgi:septal ring factor EnvC (AmiA/AmiB activator)